LADIKAGVVQKIQALSLMLRQVVLSSVRENSIALITV